MKIKNKKLIEDDLDPITMINFILNKNMQNHSFDWAAQLNKETEVEVYNKAPENLDKSTYTGVGVNEAATNLVDKEFIPPVSTVADNTMKTLDKIDTNNIDKNMVSSDPKYNACPAFSGNGICRVDGRPCLFTNADYKQFCGKYSLAKTSDPALWEIFPGRENTEEYQKGTKF